MTGSLFLMLHFPAVLAAAGLSIQPGHHLLGLDDLGNGFACSSFVGAPTTIMPTMPLP
jgi:hypothetical protein